jgi:hypothetical protein
MEKKKKEPKNGKSSKAEIDKLYREIDKGDLGTAKGGLSRPSAQFVE